MRFRYTFCFLFLSVALLLGFPLAAQYVRHWSETDFLSSRYVNHAVQDHTGFIWIATDNGLNRFDGYNFWLINTISYKTLGSNKINCLLEDNNNQLWIGTDDGLNVFDLQTCQMKNLYRHSADTSSLSANRIFDLKQDAENQVWISTLDGIIHQYLGNGKFSHIRNPAGAGGSFGLRTHLLPVNGFIYAVSEDQGGYKINKKTHHLLASFGQQLAAHPNIPALLKDGSLLLCAKEGAFIFNGEKTLQPVFSEPESYGIGNDVYQYYADFKGDEWFIRNDRKQLLQYTGGELRDRTAELFTPEENVHMRFLFEDSSHNIWICTTNGIYKISNEKPVFNHILRSDQFFKERYIPSFRGMMEDSAGTVFIGGYPGLFRRDKNGTIRQLFDNRIPYTPYTLIDKNKSELWAVCEGHGLMIVNKNTGDVHEFTTGHDKKTAHPGLYLTCGILASDGDFWLSGYDGLLRFDPDKKNYYAVNLAAGEFNFSKYVIKQIYERANKEIWFCSDKGVFVLKPDGKTVDHYNTGGKGPFHLPFDDVKCMYEDVVTGTIWFGTVQHGIMAWTKDTTRIFSTQDGLSDNAVASLTGTASGDLWIATNNGLSCLKKDNHKFINYFEEDGLAHNEFNHGSYLVGSNNVLYFGGINGISILNPDKDITPLQGGRGLVLSKVEISTPAGERITFYNQQQLNGSIVLPFESSNLYLEFFANDFLRPDKNTFEYFLEGFSKAWISLGNQNSLRFAAIPPGDYVLKIRSTNSRGTIIPQLIEIPLTVKQIFYKTWWFGLLIAVVVFGLVLFYLQLRQKRQRALAEMRMKIASNLHDDIGSVLTRIAMQAEILEEEAIPEQKTVLSSIVKSSRAAMSSMRDVVWSIDSRKSNIGSLFEKLIDHTHQQFGNTAFECAISFDKELNDIKLLPLQKQEIFLIFKEALNNAQKYATGNSITIKAWRQQDALLLLIENNSAAGHEYVSAGSGMMNMKLRAARINGTISHTRKDEKFSVYLNVPLPRKKWPFRKKIK